MSNTPRLNQQTLAQLPEAVVRPTYDRSALTTGIVHIGVGGFHRSHAACYIDDLLNAGGAAGWGICGVGLFESDRRMADALRGQDHLYTLMVKHPDGQIEHRVIGSIVDFLLGPDDPAAVTDRMASAATKIVSLTITEGGYNFSPSTGEFDFDNPDVRHELANPSDPRTVFGYLTEALRKRRAAKHVPFTVLSCDNIEHNGNVARKMLLAFAQVQDPELARWIEHAVCFPNAMVDRITPVTSDHDIAATQQALGVRDAWPVTCEPFRQWVIEDRFANGRPAWELAGAQFVADVTPYETMKLRLLNAGHSVLGLLGSLDGHATIDRCVNDPVFAAFLRRFMDLEAAPVLAPVAGIDLEAYKDTLIERFGNPTIKDRLARICLESSSKIPTFLLPTVFENLQRGGPVDHAALVIAAWCRICGRHVIQDGTPLDIEDALSDDLHAAAAGTDHDPLAFLRLEPVFGTLIDHPAFTSAYTHWTQALHDNADVVHHMQTLLSQRC